VPEYEIVRKGEGELHERAERTIGIVPGVVYSDSQFAPGDVEMAGQESWTGQRFRDEGEEQETTLRYLGYVSGKGHQYEVVDPVSGVSKPASVRSIHFGGSSSGEEGSLDDWREILTIHDDPEGLEDGS
jgi:hypothetical protein